MDILPACVSVHGLCAWCLQRPEEVLVSQGLELGIKPLSLLSRAPNFFKTGFHYVALDDLEFPK